MVQDTGSAAEQIKTEIVFKGKIECVSLRTNLARCCHVIFISIILFRARQSSEIGYCVGDSESLRPLSSDRLVVW